MRFNYFLFFCVFIFAVSACKKDKAMPVANEEKEMISGVFDGVEIKCLNKNSGVYDTFFQSASASFLEGNVKCLNSIGFIIELNLDSIAYPFTLRAIDSTSRIGFHKKINDSTSRLFYLSPHKNGTIRINSFSNDAIKGDFSGKSYSYYELFSPPCEFNGGTNDNDILRDSLTVTDGEFYIQRKRE